MDRKLFRPYRDGEISGTRPHACVRALGNGGKQVEDLIATLARGLTDLEVRVLTRFAAGESAADIAIVLEAQKTDVVQIISKKASDNRSKALNIVKTRRDLVGSVLASRPHGSASVPVDVYGPGPTTAPRVSPATRTTGLRALGKPASTPRVAAPPPSPAPAQPPTPPPSVDQVEVTDGSAGVRGRGAGQPDTAVQDTTVHAQGPNKNRENTVPDPEQTPPTDAVQLDNAVADLPPDDLPDSLDALVDMALNSASERVMRVLAEFTEQSDRLRAVLLIDRQAERLRTQIKELDREISERVALRDKLRAELEALLVGDVVVSASSAPRRARPTRRAVTA